MRIFAFLVALIVFAPTGAHAAEGDALEGQIRDLTARPETRELGERAGQNLARAKQLRELGDVERARLALGAAQDWANAGELLKATMAAEAKSVQMAQQSREKASAADKLRVEIEEMLGRLGRVLSGAKKTDAKPKTLKASGR